MVDRKRIMIFHALTLRILPLAFIVPAFLIISPFTADMFGFLDPLNTHYGMLLFFMGLIFLYEAGYALPDSGKSHAGAFAAVLVLILAALSFIYSGLTFT